MSETDTITNPVETTSESATWYIREGVPGAGPKPDFLEDKYPTMEHQARAYKDVRKALGAMTGAPEQYDLSEYQDFVDTSNPHMDAFLKFAKDSKLSQDAVKTTVKSFVEYSKSNQPDIQKELERLGPDGQRKIEVVNNWAKSTLSPKSFEALSSVPQTADVVLLMDELRQLQVAGRSQIADPVLHAESFRPLTVEEVRAEMSANRDKYLNDKNYRAEIQRKLQQVLGDS
jgi:hypothetical protein